MRLWRNQRRRVGRVDGIEDVVGRLVPGVVRQGDRRAIIIIVVALHPAIRLNRVRDVVRNTHGTAGNGRIAAVDANSCRVGRGWRGEQHLVAADHLVSAAGDSDPAIEGVRHDVVDELYVV